MRGAGGRQTAMTWSGRALVLALGCGGLAGCGGPKMLELKPVSKPKAVVTGPKATPEEVSGEVPALRPLIGARTLVPEEMVPPEPPPDPQPVFD